MDQPNGATNRRAGIAHALLRKEPSMVTNIVTLQI
jgi:hypothetical protein